MYFDHQPTQPCFLVTLNLALKTKSRRLFSSVSVVIASLTIALPVQGAPNQSQNADAATNAEIVLTDEQAKRDTQVLARVMTSLHPALTKYRTQAEIDAAIRHFEQRGQAARSLGEMYLAATELAAAVRCGHTWTNILNQQKAVQALLLESENKLPIKLSLVDHRWLVLASADAQVRVGDEILAMNGYEAAAIVEKMRPYLRADGSSDGKRLVQLNHDRFDYSQMDIVWPLLAPPQNGRYVLALRRLNGELDTVSVAATTLAKRQAALVAQGIVEKSATWSFHIERNVGFLRLPNFAFWNSKFDWAGFLEKSFAELNAKRVPHLIIDIRDNEGGSGEIGAKLLSYLLKRPFQTVTDQSVSAYERVPYALVRYLDTWDFSFFDRTGQVERITQGPNAGKYSFKPNAAKQLTIDPVAPSSRGYQGQAYLLVGPENSSATFILADLAQKSQAAILVGQPTGGNQRGLNGGQLLWVNLPNSGVGVDIPLLASTYELTTPDQSVTPDVMVKRDFEQSRAGLDQEVQAVLELIRRKNTMSHQH